MGSFSTLLAELPFLYIWGIFCIFHYIDSLCLEFFSQFLLFACWFLGWPVDCMARALGWCWNVWFSVPIADISGQNSLELAFSSWCFFYLVKSIYSIFFVELSFHHFPKKSRFPWLKFSVMLLTFFFHFPDYFHPSLLTFFTTLPVFLTMSKIELICLPISSSRSLISFISNFSVLSPGIVSISMCVDLWQRRRLLLEEVVGPPCFSPVSSLCCLHILSRLYWGSPCWAAFLWEPNL